MREKRQPPDSSSLDFETRGDRCAAESVNSVLPMVCRRRNAKALHFVKQSSAFQSEAGSRAAGPSQLPVRALTRS